MGIIIIIINKKKMRPIVKYSRSRMSSVATTEGETIEQKIERMVSNNEPIKDGAPDIYTEKKDGIISAYNIRTDRWEIAADAMDMIIKSAAAKREENANKKKEVEKAKKADPVSVDVVSAAENIQGQDNPVPGV